MLLRAGHAPGRTGQTVVIAVLVIVSFTTACRKEGPGKSGSAEAVLRVGWGDVSTTNPLLGVRQLSQILAVEGLARPAEDGRMVPSLAEGWAIGVDRRTLTVNLRPNVRFHDGSAADAATIARLLPSAMRTFMGPVFSDVENVRPSGDGVLEIAFKTTSPFLAESLEASIQMPKGIATGPYKAAPNSTTELIANEQYYLGAPTVQRVQVSTFPSIRSAWAEMLRGRIDMLYEVGIDALASLENSSTATVFTIKRHYQYVVVLNSKIPTLHSADVRRALNFGIDRDLLIRTALNGYGIGSFGPIWPSHWALTSDLPKFTFDLAAASRMVKTGVSFTCLIPPDSAFERIALEVKRQLSLAGVVMTPEQVSYDELDKRAATGQYDAMLIEAVSGPTLFRPYLFWHSKGTMNWGGFGTSTSDAALDRIRYATSEPEYRNAVAGLQRSFMNDPPAIFLAWSQRVRAVSNRFVVPVPEPGRDILSNLRLWKPTTAAQQASRN
jgi:peptide/nickel transport system substrate-binding protein